MGELRDASARDRIARALDATLFVDAGAGSGKTHALVGRVVNTVLEGSPPVPLRHIAAVTFTEKAAAELRDRLRARFERETSAADPQRAARAARALEDLDSAAIGTLHSFAQRVLIEHPIQVGLPPLIDVLDEVASGVAFDERWTALRAELLDDPDLAHALPLAFAAGVRLPDLRAMYRAFGDNWDLLAARVLATPAAPIPPVSAAPFVARAQALAAHVTQCRDDTDKFLPHLTALATWVDRLNQATDDAARLAVLTEASQLKWSYGQKGNWTCDLPTLKEECKTFVADVTDLRRRVCDAALRLLAHRIARATLDAAAARRDEGRLEFHDLLVLARDLLRHPTYGPAVRAGLREQYRLLLLDEFQDTDPIQVELAVRIAGGAGAFADDWTDVPVPEGSLFVVGDPKQSIYRFRRADIATYLRAQEVFGDRVVLNTNFRTGAPIVEWINHTFGRLIVATPGSQPEYQPLNPYRPGPPEGPTVLTLGREHEDGPDADQVRGLEAADVAAAVTAMLARRWQVDDGQGGWRDVRLADIAVLVPARTSVPYLEEAFDAAGIGYHAEASSLVYRTREIRDLLLAARAADDPSDQLALVSALRSTLFGCGDDELWTWHQGGGRWNILAPDRTTSTRRIRWRGPSRTYFNCTATAPGCRPARSWDASSPTGACSRSARTRPAPRRVAAAAVRHRPGTGLVADRPRRTARLPVLGDATGRRRRPRRRSRPPRNRHRHPADPHHPRRQGPGVPGRHRLRHDQPPRPWRLRRT
ncbi:UvrD-helicase domain-containing protein [Luedemannella flava]